MALFSLRRIVISSVSVLTAFALSAGCASQPARAGDEPEYEEGAIVHQVSDQEREAVKSKQAIAANGATLWVNGLGCPQCATNVDLQLLRLKNVEKVDVDLSVGKVDVAFGGEPHPSPAQLADAVDMAGFTLVKIETR